MKQTLNQLLVDLDGFSQTEGVIFIAATNFPELLDKALVRPGRFDRHVAVPLPDVRGRMQIIQHHMKNVQIAKDVEVSILARGTPGFSGADLANLVNQAAIQASRVGSREVNMKHMEYAKDKILMGAERRSAVITDESKRVTAYHEGGHALVAHFTPGAMPLHKATIMPRGSALGMTVQLPDMDKDSFTRKEYLAQLDVCMGGRVAEEMIFGEDNVTSGAHNDIMKATDVAKRMVTLYGMNDKVGPVSYQDDEMIQLSMQTKLVIEGEVKGLIQVGHDILCSRLGTAFWLVEYVALSFISDSRLRSLRQAAEDRAKHILKTHKEELHRLAKALIEYETLNQEEMKDVIAGRPIRR
ncbi:peptidase family M41-domain-containing protein [Jimgerdemannia flammicorona]|uniref:Peptidase family M41-domain-containing protein n=1 Tax=Jimgerdemannia flammicorona TaxID=994334 RepID=A0A433CYZ5_9FUNG|nr:peptidase family M41-domain-containing protein [Jimgerdemannia flammicorona]